MLMVGIYIFFYVGTVLLIVPGMKIRTEEKTELLTKEETNFIKGTAALMVFLAHSQDFLASCNKDSIVLRPFSVFGGMGVLLFFFLSGYGIYKGYSWRKPSLQYWKNRALKVFIPSLIISMFSCLICSVVVTGPTSILELIVNSFSGQWYVDVVMLEYLVFFISWLIAKDNSKLLLVLSTIASFFVGFAFWSLGFNTRWYNGVMLFPTGMIMAFLENKIIFLTKKKKVFIFAASLIGFGVTGTLFTMLKGKLIGDLFKTLSGILLAIFIVMFISFVKVGNRYISWIGERSLYVYLCHLYLLLLISTILQKAEVLRLDAELWFYILVMGSVLYAEVSYILLGKERK